MLDSFLRPTQIKTNQDGGLLRLIACVCMFIDHAGKMLFPQYPIMRVIGRIAFPIYAYCVAAGCVYTRNPLNYLKRVTLMALISQPLYAVALAHVSGAMQQISFAEQPLRAALRFYVESWWDPSILLTLALGILVIWTIRERQLLLTAALLLFCWEIQERIDYGFRGLMLMVLFYLFCQKWWLSLPVMLAYMVWWGLDGAGYELFGVRFGIQMFALLALPLIYIHTKSRLKIHKWAFYWFYPAHLAAILLLDRLAM